MELASLMSPALAGGFFTPSSTREAKNTGLLNLNIVGAKMGQGASLTGWITEACRRCKGQGIRSLGQEDSLEEEIETRSSILAWRIPRTEEPGGLHSMWFQRLRHDCSDVAGRRAPD